MKRVVKRNEGFAYNVMSVRGQKLSVFGRCLVNESLFRQSIKCSNCSLVKTDD